MGSSRLAFLGPPFSSWQRRLRTPPSSRHPWGRGLALCRVTRRRRAPLPTAVAPAIALPAGAWMLWRLLAHLLPLEDALSQWSTADLWPGYA